MAYPIKYIENNLVFNHDGECFAYYELLPYNYSFLSPEQKYQVRKQRAGQGRNRGGGNRRQGKYQPYHHKDHQPLGNRLLPVHVQYRYLRFCIPAHGDNDFFTGAFYHLRYVPACELSP